LQRERIVPAKRPQRQIVRWIEFLGLLGFAAVAALGLWFLADGGEVTDGSFEVAEQMRFERMADVANRIDIKEFAALEDGVNATTDHSFDYAETMRFYRIGGLSPAIGLDSFVEPGITSPGNVLPDAARIAELQAMADIHEGQYFGYMPMNHWLIVRMQELADIYEGTTFGWVPEA
jgi:hypothetical protein